MSAFEQSIENFVTGIGGGKPGDQVRRALHGLGSSLLIKTSRELSRATRLAGASSAPSLLVNAQVGRAVAPITRAIERDWIARLCVAFSVGQSIATNLSIADWLLWCGRWQQWGMPTLRVTQEQFASLSLTDIADEDLPSIASPWPALAVVIEGGFPVVLSQEALTDPDPVLNELLVNGDNFVTTGEQHCSLIALSQLHGEPMLDSELCAALGAGGRQYVAPYWQIRLDVGNANLWSGIKTTAELRDNLDGPSGAKPTAGSGWNEVDTLERRASNIGNHAALNILLAMHADGYKRTGSSGRSTGKSKFGLWSRTEYVLGSDVRINMMPALRAYLTGGAQRTYKSRWTVRGHWRSQPCGPERSERKKTWVRPHWAGHKEAPVRVRDHVL